MLETDKKYQIIYADPPWSYNDKANAGKRGAGYKYNTMTLEELILLDVNMISENDSIIFMWVTFPKLVEGTCMKVMRAWGFTPKTCAFNWIKYNKKSDSLFMGMGNWTRANSELCILGVKGKPKRINAGVRQIIETMEDDNYRPELIQSRIQQHSKKPDVARNRIVELCGDLSRIELFARENVEGWNSWGNDPNLLTK